VPRAEAARDAASQRVADLNAGRGPVVEDGDDELALAEAQGALDRAELRLAVAAGTA
jgi:hypothetical protein